MESRNEKILRSMIDGTEYTDPPMSRIEKLLLELKEFVNMGGASASDIQAVVDRYLQNHPVSAYDDREIRKLIDESIVKISDRVETKVEGGRVLPISNSVDIAQVYETAGCPEYVGNDDLSKYSSFGLTESGWYLFARINSRYGQSVSNGFSVVGASGVITPPIGSNYVDIAVRFGVIAESQKVIINWGETSETFVFKATDLAIRNLDYRVTFYLYNIDDYCDWEYELTSDEKFVANKGYYKLQNGEYIKQEVNADEEIPADVYYTHKSLTIAGFTRNMSYTLDTTADCPVTIYLPEVGGDNYGAWFEVQMNFQKTYSVTVVPSDGQKVSADGVHQPKEGINIINILYHKPTNTWLPTVTNWKAPTN